MADNALTLITECTHCSAVLQITVVQIRDGAGKARCGTCEQVFDAMANLRESDLDGSANGLTIGSPGDPFGNTSRRAAHDPMGTTHDDDPRLGLDPVWAGEEDDSTRIMPVPDEVRRFAESTTDGSGPILPWETNAAAPDIAPAPPPLDTRYSYNDALAAPAPRPAAATSHTGWYALISLLLLALLVAQMMFFEPASLLASFPQARPVVAALCSQLPCLDRAPYLFRFSARAVKEHDTHANALEVRATLNNDAAHAQPLPRIELALFDELHIELATREFGVAEYLAVPNSDEMPLIGAGESVEISLDVVTASDAAANFELRVR